jgi:hypothetical protein
MSLFDNLKGFGADLRAPENPSAINPQYGVPEGDAHAARMNSLRQMSALFMAAGQSMSGRDRAQLLAQLGDTDPSKQLYTMAQTRLMNQQVADAQDKRTRQKSALDALSKQDFHDTLTPREKAIYDAHIAAGDSDGALGFLEKVAQGNSQSLTLGDGTGVSKGAMQANITNWNKEYGAKITNLDENINVASQVLDLLDSGYVSGTGADYEIAAQKLRGLTGQQIDAATLNTEQGRSMAMGLVVNRMKDLGGNDSYEELKTLANLFAGNNLEESTIRRNFQNFIRANVRNASIATVQKSRLYENGQSEYGLPVEFKENMIPNDTLRAAYARAGGQGSAKPGGSETSKAGSQEGGSEPAVKSFKDLW